MTLSLISSSPGCHSQPVFVTLTDIFIGHDIVQNTKIIQSSNGINCDVIVLDWLQCDHENVWILCLIAIHLSVLMMWYSRTSVRCQSCDHVPGGGDHVPDGDLVPGHVRD